MPETLKWIGEGFLQNWSLELIGAVLAPALLWFVLWAIGKERLMNPDRKKLTYAVVALIGMCLIGLLSSTARYFSAQLDAIRIGSSRAGSPSAITGAVKGLAIDSTDKILLAKESAVPEFFKKNGSSCIFRLRLRNSGIPTTAWNWRMSVTLPNGQVFKGTTTDAVAHDGFLKNSEREVVLKGERFLPNYLLENPIGWGSGIDGWVVFIVPVKPDQIGVPGAKFKIEFDQADGTARSIEHTWTVEEEQ